MADAAKLLSELHTTEIYRLEVLSFEPDIYLANVVVGSETFRVYRKPGELLREFSQLGLKKHFKGLRIASTVLIHQSSYDEMIGNPAPSDGPMKVRISNPESDPS